MKRSTIIALLALATVASSCLSRLTDYFDSIGELPQYGIMTIDGEEYVSYRQFGFFLPLIPRTRELSLDHHHDSATCSGGYIFHYYEELKTPGNNKFIFLSLGAKFPESLLETQDIISLNDNTTVWVLPTCTYENHIYGKNTNKEDYSSGVGIYSLEIELSEMKSTYEGDLSASYDESLYGTINYTMDLVDTAGVMHKITGWAKTTPQ